MKIWWVSISHRHGLFTELFTDEPTALRWFIGQFIEESPDIRDVEYWLEKFETFQGWELYDWYYDDETGQEEWDEFNYQNISDWAWGNEDIEIKP